MTSSFRSLRSFVFECAVAYSIACQLWEMLAVSFRERAFTAKGVTVMMHLHTHKHCYYALYGNDCRGAFCAAGEIYGSVYPLESFVSFVVVESGFVIRFILSSSSNKYFEQPANGHCALRAGSYPYIVNGSFAVTVTSLMILSTFLLQST